MEEYDLRDVSYEKLNRGYENQWELMDDLFAWLDLRIYFFYEHHQWLGPKNDMRNMMGLVVSREEFEHNLVKAAQLGLAAQLDGGEAAQLESSQVTIRALPGDHPGPAGADEGGIPSAAHVPGTGAGGV